MKTLERLYELKNDLIEKRDLLENNKHNLSMFKAKDMPLAIYDHVISKLKEIADETK